VDVRQMFGEASALDRCEIDLCIEFRDSTDENPDRTESGVHSFSLLGVGVPRIRFVVNGSQSLSVLVETAVRYITRDGETGGREFVDRYNASLIETFGSGNNH